jgi:hypothetical protein
MSSCDRQYFTNRLGRNSTQSVFEAILQDEPDSLAQVLQAFLAGETLAIGARYLRTETYPPLIIAFEDGGKLVSHLGSIASLVPDPVLMGRAKLTH